MSQRKPRPTRIGLREALPERQGAELEGLSHLQGRSKAKLSLAKPARAMEHIPAGFTFRQLRRLLRPVDPTHVQSREVEGRTLSYIEGWYAISQANAIFGYAGWDREMVHFERVTDRRESDNAVCGYIARVRIRVRAGGSQILREGSGWGWALARTASAAHERALKSAETDATKRALATFGPSFGLSLYDKDSNNQSKSKKPGLILITPDGKTLADALSPERFSTGLRQLIELCRKPEELQNLRLHNQAAITALRSLAPSLRNVQGTHFADLLFKLMDKAQSRLSGTRTEPARQNGLTDSAGSTDSADHIGSKPAPLTPDSDFKRYVGQSERRKAGPIARAESRGAAANGSAADSLEAVAKALNAHPLEPGKQEPNDSAIPVAGEIALIEPAGMTNPPQPPVDSADTSMLAPSRIAFGQRIDKSLLPLGYERRLRDKNHLRRVAELPCLICSRQPSHAHHLRFAQRRGLGQKVSDEYVVPLCAIHHGDLHRSHSEQHWWERQKIDPMQVSNELWESNNRQKRH